MEGIRYSTEKEEQLPVHDYIPIEWVQRSGDAQAYPANS